MLCIIFPHAGSTPMQIHWPQTPTLSFYVGQGPEAIISVSKLEQHP